ncbi:MAG: TonB family protein [Acidobacteriota bacterium]|nr:MAG: TonB family protein [Acidobacteriota bacterium]
MSRRVLVIDTNSRALGGTVSLLRSRGFEPIPAGSPAEIKRAIEGELPRLILIEPLLQGLNGFELCRAIVSRAMSSGRPLAYAVLLASHRLRGAPPRARAREVGARCFLERPNQDSELIALLERFGTAPAPARASSSVPTADRQPIRVAAPSPPPTRKASAASEVELANLVDDELDAWVDQAFTSRVAPPTAGAGTMQPKPAVAKLAKPDRERAAPPSRPVASSASRRVRSLKPPVSIEPDDPTEIDPLSRKKRAWPRMAAAVAAGAFALALALFVFRFSTEDGQEPSPVVLAEADWPEPSAPLGPFEPEPAPTAETSEPEPGDSFSFYRALPEALAEIADLAAATQADGDADRSAPAPPAIERPRPRAARATGGQRPRPTAAGTRLSSTPESARSNDAGAAREPDRGADARIVAAGQPSVAQPATEPIDEPAEPPIDESIEDPAHAVADLGELDTSSRPDAVLEEHSPEPEPEQTPWTPPNEGAREDSQAVATPAPVSDTDDLREPPVITVALDSRPRLIPGSRTEPAYPIAARRMRIGGTVELRALVGVDGRPERIEIVNDPSPQLGLGKAAVDAVRRWRYRPGRRNGQPVAEYVTIRIVFNPP